jgi:MFS family permease
MNQVEQRTMKKVFRRLVPFLMFCYFFNFLDRVNVSFAALDMNRDLGFSASVFGFGSGILFLSYMLCETPSNALLARFGARKWLARIMVSWGIIASCMVFVSGEYSFYTIRVFLGAAEAGFFPGIIYYLTLWFPGVYRARVTGLFMACIPLSAAIGSPLWHPRPQRLAVAVPAGRPPFRPARRRDVLLSHRTAKGCDGMAGAGRAELARRPRHRGA